MSCKESELIGTEELGRHMGAGEAVSMIRQMFPSTASEFRKPDADKIPGDRLETCYVLRNDPKVGLFQPTVYQAKMHLARPLPYYTVSVQQINKKMKLLKVKKGKGKKISVSKDIECS